MCTWALSDVTAPYAPHASCIDPALLDRSADHAPLYSYALTHVCLSQSGGEAARGAPAQVCACADPGSPRPRGASRSITLHPSDARANTHTHTHTSVELYPLPYTRGKKEMRPSMGPQAEPYPTTTSRVPPSHHVSHPCPTFTTTPGIHGDGRAPVE
jgi:hypothetical protein